MGKDTQLECWFGFGIFDNRITLAADYYDKTTKDLLYQVSVPGTMGFTQAWGNIGSIKIKGLRLN